MALIRAQVCLHLLGAQAHRQGPHSPQPSWHEVTSQVDSQAGRSRSHLLLGGCLPASLRHNLASLGLGLLLWKTIFHPHS